MVGNSEEEARFEVYFKAKLRLNGKDDKAHH